MFWLLERRFTDKVYLLLAQNLVRLGVQHTYVKVVPFTGEIVEIEGLRPADWIIEPIFTFGSYSLAKMANEKWKPGAFVSENIDMDRLLENWGDEMMNSDMQIGSLSTIDPNMPEFFIRPVKDSKSFTAQVITKSDFEEWKQKVFYQSKQGYATVTPSTRVVVASPKNIQQEIRFFVVDRKIITSSVYKIGKDFICRPIVDSFVTEYVENIISKEWQPELAYCLDIAVTEGQPKILEVNCINSSGLYALDTQKFIMAIEALTERFN